jgi:UDP-glucose 4-epimerase
MHVLVTGGAGFIGSHIVDQLLAGGHTCAVLDDLSSGVREQVPAGVPFYEVDTRDAAGVARVFEQECPAAVCHQAAQMSVSRSVREPAFDADVNLIGLLNVLDCARRSGAERFVFASSGGVLYGEVESPASEEHPAAPISPYGISKWAGERYLEFFAREYGLPGVALRYANVYGPRQNPHGEAGVVAIFCRRLLAGEPATINGDGGCVRDYVEVADVARANIAALERPLQDSFTAYNVGTGLPTDVNQLAARLLEECRRSLAERGRTIAVPDLQRGPARAGDLRKNLVNADKARRELAWCPQTGLAEGLKHTVDWFADHP